MAIIENSVQIARPPEAVFDYCVDLRNELAWNPDVESMEKVTDGPIGVGTCFRAKWKHSKEILLEFTRFERPHAWQTVNGGPLAIVFDGRVVPEEGGSRLDIRFEVRPQKLARLFFPLLLLVLKRAERRNMRCIKQALETA